jgi:hypothetical protein
MIKKTIITIACCALIAPLAFGQSSKQKSKTTSEQGVTVTGTLITAVEEGSATSYQPPKTLVVREDRSNETGHYVLNGPGHVVNKKGEIITTAVKPGAHVHIFFASTNGVRTIDHVVVD